MAARAPDRIPLEEWRESYWTVERMIQGRWALTGYCELCDLRVRVRLRLIRLAIGPQMVLWGRTLACPRWGCSGRMQIASGPPQLTQALDVGRGC